VCMTNLVLQPSPQPPGDVGLRAVTPTTDPSAAARQPLLPEASFPAAKLGKDAPEVCVCVCVCVCRICRTNALE